MEQIPMFIEENWTKKSWNIRLQFSPIGQFLSLGGVFPCFLDLVPDLSQALSDLQRDLPPGRGASPASLKNQIE